MLLVPDKQSDAAPTSGWLIALIVVGVGMALVAVLGIILAIAIPYYISYKRTVCDRMARQELAHVQDAYNKYRNDPNNKTQEPPQDLRHLVGSYYGWQGTSEKCDVRIHYDRKGQTVSVLSLKGAHPQGVSSRYVYKRHLENGKERAAQVVPRVEVSKFLRYPSATGGRKESCFTKDGQLLEECRKAQEQK
jgi:Tfp pilus assembly protein PilE